MDFYTSAFVWGNKILYRGYRNGLRVQEKVDYAPSLFVPSSSTTPYKTVKNASLDRIDFSSIKEAKEFYNNRKDVANSKVHGNTKYEYPFIAEKFPGDVDWNIEHVLVSDIDIETKMDGPIDLDNAPQEVTAITLALSYNGIRTYHVFGCKDYNNSRSDVKYYKCSDEIDLLKTFLVVWSRDYPDLVTGWNILLFDIPYLYNRIKKLLGEKEANRLSPWSIVQDKEVDYGMGRSFNTYTLKGLAILDYMDLYQRFAPDGKSQESYKLDSIAFAELGEKKLDYSAYGNLNRLYEENYQQFVDYNIRDVDLVDKMNDKLQLIELALTLSYYNKVNYEDIFTQVRMWTVIISNFLKDRNIFLDHSAHDTKSYKYEGAYVKPPLIGKHKKVISFDFTSLYPSMFLFYNISPETIVEPEDYPDEVRTFVAQNRIDVDSMMKNDKDLDFLKKFNMSMTPNGHFFRRDKQGFIPEIIQKMFDNRQHFKTLMKDTKKLYEQAKKNGDSEERQKELKYLISKYNNLQLCFKVCLNSCYGAFGNEFFILYDLRQAVAITLGGQLSVKWVEQRLNKYLQKLLKAESDKDYVIGIDTDSIYLTVSDLIDCVYDSEQQKDVRKVIRYMDKICKASLTPEINKYCDQLYEYVNGFEQKLDMKREALADVGIWTSKKHYVLNVYDNEGVEYTTPEIKIVGMEAIKSSTPSACRDKIKEAYKIALLGDEKTLQKFVTDFKNDFKKMEPSEIAFPRGVNGLETYSDKDTVYSKGCPIHVRGSLVYNDLLKKNNLEKTYEVIKSGNKIKFLYLKEPNTIGSNIISFPDIIPKEFDITDYIDYNTQYEKAFIDPIKSVTEAIGWDVEKRSSLANFFKKP